MDVNCTKLLIGGNINRAKHKVMNYIWDNDVLMFQDLMVPRPKERDENVNLIQEEIGYFNEQRIIVEVKKWHLGMIELNQSKN